jgi:hypothetical protein
MLIAWVFLYLQKKVMMYNPKLSEITPLQCYKCGNKQTAHRYYPTVQLAIVECNKCEFRQVLQKPIYDKLRIEWLKYKLSQWEIIHGLCKN